MLNCIGVFIEILFSGGRRPVEPPECNEMGVPGDCDDGISRGKVRCGVCRGGISLGIGSGGGTIADFLAFLVGPFLIPLAAWMD